MILLPPPPQVLGSNTYHHYACYYLLKVMLNYNYDCVYMNGMWVWLHACEHQGTTLCHHFSLSTFMWVPRIKLWFPVSAFLLPILYYEKKFSNYCVEPRALGILADWASSLHVWELMRFPFFLFGRVSLHSPGTHYIDQAVFKLTEIWVLGLKACSNVPHSNEVS